MSKAFKQGFFDGLAMVCLLVPIVSALLFAVFDIRLWVDSVGMSDDRSSVLFLLHLVSLGGSLLYFTISKRSND